MLTALNWPGFADLSLAGLLFLCAAAFLAGAVDAIVGGGGLIQLPAMLMLMPGGAVIYSLATSKIAAVTGTSAAARTYAARTPMDWWATWPMAGVALAGSLGGAALADTLPSSALNIVVLFALVAVGVYTWRTPSLGVHEQPRSRRTKLVVMLLGGAMIGFWDGIAGPGTGSFLVFWLVSLAGFAFVTASATAKVVNVATNLGALVFFIPAGKVLWGLGITMAACNISGSVVGAMIATTRGSAFIRRMFLTVVTGLVLSLGWKLAIGG